MRKRQANRINRKAHEIMLENWARSSDPNDPINKGRCVSIKVGQAFQASKLKGEK
jgi:hypothetical protein